MKIAARQFAFLNRKDITVYHILLPMPEPDCTSCSTIRLNYAKVLPWSSNILKLQTVLRNKLKTEVYVFSSKYLTVHFLLLNFHPIFYVLIIFVSAIFPKYITPTTFIGKLVFYAFSSLTKILNKP